MKRISSLINQDRFTRQTLRQVLSPIFRSLVLRRLQMLLMASVIFISSAGGTAEMCLELFEPSLPERVLEQDRALAKIAIQHFYEAANRFLQTKVTVSSYRSSTAQQATRKVYLDYYLKNGKSEEAIDLYRKTFDWVELSYWMVTQDRLALENLKYEPNSIIKARAWWRLKARISVYEKRFARYYGEYKEIRQYLSKLADAETDRTIVNETAKNAFKYLSVHKFSVARKDFESLGIPERRPTMDEIAALFRSRANFTRLMLQQEFRTEILTVIKFLFTAEIVINSIDLIFSKFPPDVAFKLKAFMGILQSAKIRHREIPKIIEIESLPFETEKEKFERLNDLLRKNSTSRNDDLMITYARIVEFKDSWWELEGFAKELAEKTKNPTDMQNYKRMKDAHDRALTLSDISIIEKVSNIDHLYTIIQTGILLKMVGPSVFQSGTDVLNLIAHAPWPK